MPRAHTLGRGLGLSLLVALLALSGNSVGCQGAHVGPGRALATNARGARAGSVGPASPASRRLEQYRLSLAASVAENQAKDAEISALRRQFAALQSRHDALAARIATTAHAPVAQGGWELLDQ